MVTSGVNCKCHCCFICEQHDLSEEVAEVIRTVYVLEMMVFIAYEIVDTEALMKTFKPGMVANACNPSSRWRQGD